MVVEGKFLRQRKDLICAAIVTLSIKEGIQNTIIQVGWDPSPYVGYDDWKQGAVVGIEYALTKTGSLQQYEIEVKNIVGTDVDTTPTIVAIAAVLATWQGLNYKFTQEELQQLETAAIASCNRLKSGDTDIDLTPPAPAAPPTTGCRP
jgi:hypothetical protein